MGIFEAIKNRRSVRTFDGKDLSAEDAKKILDFANAVTNPYDLKIQWKLLSLKGDGLSTPVIVGADTFIAGKMAKVPHAEEAFGYAFEKIVLFAQSMGVGTTWIAGTMDRAAFEKAMDLREGEVMPCVSPLGYTAPKMSIRESMMRVGVKADSRMNFKELFFDGSFDKPLEGSAAGRLNDVLEMVRLAPSAVNKQPWRVVISGDRAHFYEKRSKGYINDGWDVQMIDMGIAMYHFEAMCEEKGIKTEFVAEKPEINANDCIYVGSFVIRNN